MQKRALSEVSQAALGLPPLREHWRAINRQDRQAQAQARAQRQARDKRRGKCRCAGATGSQLWEANGAVGLALEADHYLYPGQTGTVAE